MRELLQTLSGWSRGPLRPWCRNVIRVVDVRLQVERGNHRLGFADIDLGPIDRLRHFGGTRLRTHRNFGSDQHLLQAEVQRLRVDDPLDARCGGRRPFDPSDGIEAGRFAEQQALGLDLKAIATCETSSSPIMTVPITSKMPLCVSSVMPTPNRAKIKPTSSEVLQQNDRQLRRLGRADVLAPACPAAYLV